MKRAVLAFSLCLLFVGMSTTTWAQTSVFINEIHYDNSGSDVGEAIEIAGPSATNLSGWSLVLYNGSTGAEYNSHNLTDIIPDLGGGFGVITVDVSPAFRMVRQME